MSPRILVSKRRGGGCISLVFSRRPPSPVTCSLRFKLDPQNYQCNPSCPSGYYPRALDLTCQKCSPDCPTCTALGSSFCTACYAPSILLETTYGGGVGLCVVACPSNMYLETGSGTRICQLCDPSCLTCSGPTASNCLTCSGAIPLYFQSNQCVLASQCLSTTYAKL